MWYVRHALDKMFYHLLHRSTSNILFCCKLHDKNFMKRMFTLNMLWILHLEHGCRDIDVDRDPSDSVWQPLNLNRIYLDIIYHVYSEHQNDFSIILYIAYALIFLIKINLAVRNVRRVFNNFQTTMELPFIVIDWFLSYEQMLLVRGAAESYLFWPFLI